MSEDQGVSHHGPPVLTENDVRLCQAVSLWIATARKWNSWNASADWLPSYPDFVKSRLFWRIRSGKEPLPEPPPTCFSCPWYEVIEVDEPHDVWDVHVSRWKPEDPERLSVAQCGYDIIERREDGSMIVGFNRWRFRAWKDGKWWIQRMPSLETPLAGSNL